MFLRILLTLIFCLTATLATAGSVDIGLNDKSFQIGYVHPVNQDEYGIVTANGRFLYNDDNETSLASFGLDFIGKPGNIPGLGYGVGTKFYLGKTDPNIDFINLAIGLQASYLFSRLQGLGVSGKVYYAPQVFSFKDAERLLEGEFRVSYAILPKAKVYVGYQYINLDVKQRGDRDLSDSVRIGFVGTF